MYAIEPQLPNGPVRVLMNSTATHANGKISVEAKPAN